MKIKYGVGPSPIGKLLVAQSDKGLCAVRVRASEAELERGLREQFADADVVRDDNAVAPLRKKVLDAIAGKSSGRSPTLDIQGTEFQRKVWSELRKIPAGATRSYADVAKAIGKPKATRAVANACGKNPIPVLVPCHRVIAKDGSIGGYTGGLRVKRALLDAEGVQIR